MESEQASQLQQSVKYQDGSFKWVEEEIPQPGKGQILVEVQYSTINPYDRLIFGVNKVEGFVMGSDGCGFVRKVGEGVDQALIGSLVSFFQGAWSRYTIKNLDQVIVYQNNEDFDPRNAANAYVNPLTACGLIDFAKKHNATAVVILAASSQLAKQMIKLCKLEGLETVNIVRRDEHVKDLTENLEVKYVLNQESPTFLEDLVPILKDTQATILLECLGGDLPGDIFAKMPAKSWMVVYGSLTKKRTSFDAYDFRWSDKNITSFVLYRWLISLEPEVKQQQYQRVADDLQNNKGQIFGSQIAKEVPLEEWREAMEESEKVASEGKFLIKCNRN